MFCQRSVWMLVLVLAFAAVRPCASESFAQSETPDSGIYGIVPHYRENLKWIEDGIETVQKQAAHPETGQGAKKTFTIFTEALLDKWKNRCVEAYDAQSRPPLAYSPTGDPGPPRNPNGAFIQDRLGLYTSRCSDQAKFPRGYMKLIAASGCASDGEFRLPMKSGRYEVFVGQEPYVGFSDSGNPWHQLIVVKPHEWQHVSEPKGGWSGALCITNAQCVPGYVCAQAEPGWGNELRSEARRKICQSSMEQPPLTHDSGIRGRVGTPIPIPCFGNSPAFPLPVDFQCVEAFHEGDAEIAACGACSMNDNSFTLPLAPGRYTLEFYFPMDGQNPGLERRAIEVRDRQWVTIYTLGAKPGPVDRKPACAGPPA